MQQKKEAQMKNRYSIRSNYCFIYWELWNYDKKIMDIDYFQYEDAKTQRLKQKAQEAFEGNVVGLEGILHNDVDTLASFLGLCLYAGVISGASPWIVLMLMGISVVQIGTYCLANRYELGNKDAPFVILDEPTAALDPIA